MKHLLLFASIVMISMISSYGQKTKTLTPSRGHYKQLEAFSGKTKSSNEGIDKQKFITDKETVEKRMSLKPIYLKNITAEDFKIPDVPANSSDKTRAEINYLLALQKYRNEQEVKECLYLADIYYNLRIQPNNPDYPRYRRNLFHIGRSVGSWFNPETLPVTADLMARVWQDASYFIWSLKFKYARIRPVVIDPNVKNQQETDWAAYPSGHAANSYINAYIYLELAPEFTDVFVKDAYDMAHSREIIGVHYPSDSESARIFARQFVNLLFQNESFLKDFENVKKEWAMKAREDFK
ncbi:MAG: phosphatase [Cyclobacteriaceae bacterium]|nr:phosphatase [Cyclobacteriaceae bacterium]